MPGNNGGANWGGAAVDPDRGIVVVVSKDLPCLLRLEPDKTAPPGVERYVSGFGFMIGSNGLGAIRPPWTTLTAYDLNDGVIKWQIPLGEVPDLESRGVRGVGTHYPKVGPVITAGGLVFTGTRDRRIRAFDLETGKVVFEKQIEMAMEGIPAIFEAEGREYIVFCAAAQAGLTRAAEEPVRGAYVAFALPRSGAPVK
jgi:quinoprotein glucose dehydrogenase